MRTPVTVNGSKSSIVISSVYADQDKEGTDFLCTLNSHLTFWAEANGCEVLAQLSGQPQWGGKVLERSWIDFNHLRVWCACQM